MTAEIPKTYAPAAIEPVVYDAWLRERCFHAEPDAPGEPYCIVIPPPNVTGALHLGHAINNTLQDILIRVHRMRGFNTLWIPGIDHAGIATQAVVEKQLKEKENKTRHDVGREGLVERIWQWKEQFGERILEQLKRLGCSCDWDRTRFTLDEQCARAVRETFFKLFKDGLIYRGKRLVNWDIQLQTSISDDEIYHETVKTSLWHIRYPIADDPAPHVHAGLRPTHMTVATTRPETLLGDTAVAVHSEDARWNWAIGKFVKLPLTDRLIPIIADDILVDPKFGSGVVKVTPAHDPNDYAVYQRHLGQPDAIEILNILNPDGTLNDNAGNYAGMKRDAARKKVVEDLTAQGLLEKEEPYETQVGHSDRSKTPIEPYLSDQWFVKMAPLAEPALKVVEDGTIQFFPERHKQQYLSWLGEKRDWPISRQLWWGHRIPVWTMLIEAHPFSTGDDLRKHWLEQRERADEAKRLLSEYLEAAGANADEDVFFMPGTDEISSLEVRFCLRTELASNALDAFGRMYDSYIPRHTDSRVFNYVPGFENATNAYFRLVKKITIIVQDPDVLDTWFSSALWPHSTLGWPADTAELRKWYPTSVLLTGRDIVTLWVARMVMMGMYNMGAGAEKREGKGEGRKSTLRSQPTTLSAKAAGIPFHHVAINPTILDGKGERMSKSKGNGVDPVDVIETHGADALRFTLATMATETQDVRMPVKKDAQGRNTSDKFDIGSRFCNKIWQVAHFFVIPNLQNIAPQTVDESKWSIADRWIVSRFGRAVADADAALAEYRFDQYAKICYDFFYGDFCDWYVEASKPAIKDSSRSGQTADILAAILDGSLRLMHPMIPFITESIWWRLNEVRADRSLGTRLTLAPSNRLILAKWPGGAGFNDADERAFAQVQEVVRAVRKLRNDFKVDAKKMIDATIAAPADLAENLLASRSLFEQAPTNCKLKQVAPGAAAPRDSATAVAAGCDIFVEGLVNVQAQSQRSEKRHEELTRLIGALEGRLRNSSYVDRAPAHLVQQTRDQLAEAKQELAKLR